MVKSAMPERKIMREGGEGSSVSKLGDRDYSAREECSVVRVNRGTEESLPLVLELHQAATDPDVDGTRSGEVENREEIGTEFRYMQHSREQHLLPTTTIPSLWSKEKLSNTGRIDYCVAGKANRRPERLIVT